MNEVRRGSLDRFGGDKFCGKRRRAKSREKERKRERKRKKVLLGPFM